ncbi:MAG: YceH family protein [Acidimicrobiaceae bacterium]|nr:YceH family protein [Acidimicrobiaceae bacterium]
MVVLSPEELRVLGCLIEKSATTPDQYPLTMNGLLLACNQTSNRNPVVDYDQAIADTALARLRELKLARIVHQPGGRADKYRHVVDETWGLTDGELAVLAVLALRGPQTVNELRTRTERYAGLDEMGGVDGVLHRLKNRYEEPYVTRLERQPGQREERWAHLLAGEVIDVPEAPPTRTPRAAVADRLDALEAEVAALREEVTRLRSLWE